MTDFEVQVAGRVVALEFVLEVMLANGLAIQPPERTEAFKNGLASEKAFMRQNPFDAHEAQAVEAEARAVMQRFVENVDKREANFRKHLP